jgi:hypothetical protein
MLETSHLMTSLRSASPLLKLLCMRRLSTELSAHARVGRLPCCHLARGLCRVAAFAQYLVHLPLRHQRTDKTRSLASGSCCHCRYQRPPQMQSTTRAPPQQPRLSCRALTPPRRPILPSCSAAIKGISPCILSDYHSPDVLSSESPPRYSIFLLSRPPWTSLLMTHFSS